MALLKNHRGEYNYHFYWVDENGRVTGFNDVWAFNKREAVKLAKKMEKQAQVEVYINTESSLIESKYLKTNEYDTGREARQRWSDLINNHPFDHDLEQNLTKIS